MTDKTPEQLAWDWSHKHPNIGDYYYNSEDNKLSFLSGYQAATERRQAEIAEKNIIITELNRRFWDLRLKIIKEAKDTVWYSPYETAVDFIDSVLEKTKAAKDK